MKLDGLKQNKSIFISYSHSDEESMVAIVKHLKFYNLNSNLDIWVDKSIEAGDEWKGKIREAIDKADIAILLISNDFLTSKFIQKKELPWLNKQYNLKRIEIIPFIVKPCNWKDDSFISKFQHRPQKKSALVTYNKCNGEQDEVLAEFAKEVNNKYTNEDTKITVVNDNPRELFYKAFAIYRALDLYNEHEEYSYKLGSNLSIYQKGLEYPIEIWSFLDDIASIEICAKKLHSLFNKDNTKTQVGIVQSKGLSHTLNELSSFFNLLKKIKIMDKMIIRNMISTLSSYDISTFVSEFFNGSIKDISFMDINPTSNTTGSIFLFSNFNLVGYQSNELYQYIFKIIEEKFNKILTHDGNNIFAVKAFKNVFEKVLEYLEINKGRQIKFEEVISRIDLLKIDLPITKSVDFKTYNKTLIQHEISNKANVNIKNLYVEPKAILTYMDKVEKRQQIDSLYEFIKRDIKNINFLIFFGDFGHGKTTFFKYITAKFSEQYKKGEYIPIYLSMRHHFIKNSTLKDAVSNALLINEKITDTYWNKHKWLIFCDGFDELNIYHQNEPNWVTFIFTTLLNESKNNNIKIVLSSRPVLFLDPSVKKDTVNQFDRLILKPFNELQIKKWLKNWSNYNKPITLEMIKNRNLLEITKTPVILFLIATIFHEELNEDGKSYNKSQVYKRFFDWTAKNGGFIQQGEGIKHSVPPNYRIVLQEIATIIFMHPEAKSGMIHYKILLEELKEIFCDLRLNDTLNHKIFVAHAFRESLPEHIEFIHQSLREYLVAEKVFNSYFDFCTSNHEEQAVFQFDYNKIVFTRHFSEAKLNFFRGLIEVNIKKGFEFMHKVDYFVFDLNAIYEYFIQKDLTKINTHFSFLDEKLIKSTQYGALGNIVANIVLLDYLFKIYSKREVQYVELNKILHYFHTDSELDTYIGLLRKSITNFTSHKIEIKEFDFSNFDLTANIYLGVTFNKCEFELTNLSSVRFHQSGEVLYPDNTILTPTSFKKCSFKHVELNSTIFRNVEFNNCQFENQQFIEDFQLENVEFKECIFDKCDLQKNNFSLATFTDCIFKDCSFIDFKADEMDIDNFIIIDCVFE